MRPVKLAIVYAGILHMTQAAHATPPNQVLGTWRMVSATVDPDGKNAPAYGARPNGLLVFTPDMHYVEVLLDTDVPKFASNARGQGTDAENRAAMAGSLGQFGTYTVDGNGAFSGDVAEGATFPNWNGAVRTTKELRIVVEGDRVTENFQRPDGTRIALAYERVR